MTGGGVTMPEACRSGFIVTRSQRRRYTRPAPPPRRATMALGLRRSRPAISSFARTAPSRATGFRVRLGRERTPVARCSWCRMPIVETEVDPASGKPCLLDGRRHHEECRDYRRRSATQWSGEPSAHEGRPWPARRDSFRRSDPRSWTWSDALAQHDPILEVAHMVRGAEYDAVTLRGRPAGDQVGEFTGEMLGKRGTGFIAGSVPRDVPRLIPGR
jgi:hypothetical protein